MSTLDSILSQYEKNSNRDANKMTSEERLKKYFTCFLPSGEKNGQKRIRILPPTDGMSPFKEVWFHEVQVDGKWVKIYDPGKNDNERSPLNELFEELMSTGNEEDKKLASTYRARKFFIVKVIDRDAEEDGPKFWRFKENYKNEGIMDKIIPIFKSKGDITDPKTGRDLIIQLSKAKTNNGKEYTTIQTIMQDDSSPLNEDKKKAKLWMEDELTWSDVYSKKPLEYLTSIAKGEVPKWDSILGKYVSEDADIKNLSATKVVNSNSEEDDEEVGEMPF